MPLRIACIVEGHGDARSIPGIVRRVAHAEGCYQVELLGPYRVNKGSLVRPEGLERAVERASRALGGDGAVLVVVDADDDLPCQLGPLLTDRARAARGDVAICVVIANREKEAWYLSAARSLRGQRGWPEDATPPPAPEAIRDAKGWIADVTGRSYSETTDQVALAALFGLSEARSASSFDRLYRFIQSQI